MKSRSSTYIGAAGLGGLAAAMYLDSKYGLLKDIQTGLKMAPMAMNLRISDEDRMKSVTNIFRDAAAAWPDKVAFHYVDENRDVTFKDVHERSNKLANWLAGPGGVRRGDVVSIYMTNCPEFVITWLAISKVGAVGALINYNLAARSLRHCLEISGSKLVIFSASLGDRIREVGGGSGSGSGGGDDVLSRMRCVSCGGSVPFAECIDGAVEASSASDPDKALRKGLGMNDTLFFIYTSGTTGLPKAAIVKNAKLYTIGKVFGSMFNVTHEDTVYTALPLYHSAGGMVGVGLMAVQGCTLVMRSKFSASRFWGDVRAHGATVTQYIGELCRYLLHTEPSAADRDHKLRLAIGNGLRPDVWEQFMERFAIAEVGEFYGATEGNVGFFNHCKRGDRAAYGAIGHTGLLFKKIMGWKNVKFDVEKEEPVRDEHGFLVEAASGEPGELIGAIVDNDPSKGFYGYHGNKEATEKKILRDAFVKGDKYFRTGDLVSVENGYVYFVDRIGDTFRWKSENVSTTEVAETVSTFPGVKECNVVGVEVPGTDGRACLAAIVAGTSDDDDAATAASAASATASAAAAPLAAGEEALDLEGLLDHVTKELPSYARPLFLRMLPEVEITGTFKHRKVRRGTMMTHNRDTDKADEARAGWDGWL